PRAAAARSAKCQSERHPNQAAPSRSRCTSRGESSVHFVQQSTRDDLLWLVITCCCCPRKRGRCSSCCRERRCSERAAPPDRGDGSKRRSCPCASTTSIADRSEQRKHCCARAALAERTKYQGGSEGPTYTARSSQCTCARWSSHSRRNCTQATATPATTI